MTNMSRFGVWNPTIYGIAAGVVFALGGTAYAKKAVPPPNSPPPLTDAERNVGIRGVQFSDIIEAAGPSTVARGVIRREETLLTIPYRYRYTAMLTEDVKGFSFTVGGVQAPAGSPGYYAGSFIQRRGSFGIPEGPPMDMWCFFPGVMGGKRKNICLLRNSPKLAAIAPTRMNPYLWSQFSPMTGSFDYVKTPIFERQPVDLPIKPVLEFKFAGWAGDAPKFRLFAVGDFVRELSIPKDDKGSFRLRTVGGDYIVTRDAGDPDSVQVSPSETPS